MSEEEKKIYYVPVIYKISGKVPVRAKSLKKAYNIVRNNSDIMPIPVNPEYIDGSLIPAEDMLPDDEDKDVYNMLYNIYSDIHAEEPIFEPGEKNRK